MLPLRAVRSSMRALVAAAALVAAMLIAPFGATPAAAADYSGFQPGNIISDAIFFDAQAMSDAQIQSFLAMKVPRCTAGYVCLKDYTEITSSRAADAYCAGYQGGSRESASSIIGKVARACGINPRVLLVTLQKEQGLVTSTAPTAVRYQKAMGFACPDTPAGCDPKFSGFFYQVYSAAHRFKEYELSGRYSYYGPRRTVSIRFHPDQSCGSSPVYVANQATANLYYYTPYQPNKAALDAGAGASPDRCATYGNRNFYRYFTEWFGTTQGATPRLVRTSSNPTVFLIDGQQRFPVTDYGHYIQLTKIFGSALTVSQSFLDGLAAQPAAGVIFRESSGRILMVQGGEIHRFPTCAVLSLWGASCAGGYANVSTALFGKARVGGEMSEYFAVAGTPTRGRLLAASQVQPYGDTQDMNVYAGRSVGWVPTISREKFAALTRRPLQFAPGRLVKRSDAPEVYLTAGTNQLHRIASFAVAADLGRPSATMRTVNPHDLDGYTRQVDLVRPVVTCGEAYLGAGGRLHPVEEAIALHDGGIPAWDNFTCAQYARTGAQLSNPVLVKSRSGAQVWAVQGRERRPIYSWADAQRLTSSSKPAVATLEDGTLATWGIGRAALRQPALIKGTPAAVWAVVGDSQRMHVPSFALAREWGYRDAHAVLPDAAVAAFQDTRTPLSWWVRCGSPDGPVALVGGGRLFTTTDAAASGFSAPAVPQALCDATTKGPHLERVFVKDSGSDRVYLAENGTVRWVKSWNALLAANGGTQPTLVPVAPAVISTVRTGPSLG